jgi:hypothetical protein
MSEKLPYPNHAARSWPKGVTPEFRKIERCSEPNLWYRNKVGQIIQVHYFMSFGAWDTEGRWLWYYDLSEPIDQPDKVEKKQKKSFFKKLFG